MNETSIFTRIINGEIPAHKIYEDEHTLAFLDINPNTQGHTLVVPKVQVDKFYDLEDENYQALMTSVKKVASRLQDVMQPARVGMIVQGFEVPHVHVHLMPIERGSDMDHDRRIEPPTYTELAQLAERLAF